MQFLHFVYYYIPLNCLMLSNLFDFSLDSFVLNRLYHIKKILGKYVVYLSTTEILKNA